MKKGLLFLLAIAACSPQLRAPEKPPEQPVEGLWVEDAARTEVDRFSILWIEKKPVTAPDSAPYQFSLVRFVGRNLAISDQSLFTTRRKGDARTSGKEILLIQNTFQRSLRSVVQKQKSIVWPAADFGTEEDQRVNDNIYNLDVLTLSADGTTLSGSSGTFYRAASPGYARYQQAAVWRVDPAAHQISLFGMPAGRFTPGMMFKNANADCTLRVTAQTGEYITASIEKGIANPGDIFLPVDSKEETQTKALTKEEILERVRRGQYVPQEDLLRVLGDKK